MQKTFKITCVEIYIINNKARYFTLLLLYNMYTNQILLDNWQQFIVVFDTDSKISVDYLSTVKIIKIIMRYNVQ